MEQNREWVMICWLSFGVRFFPFSFSRSPCSVPGSWSPFLVSRSPFFLLPSPLPLLCSPFLRFPVSCSSFSASLSPRSSFFVILFFYKIVNNEAIVHNSFEWKNNQKLELLDVSMFWLMVAEELKQMIQSPYGFNSKIYFLSCVC